MSSSSRRTSAVTFPDNDLLLSHVGSMATYMHFGQMSWSSSQCQRIWAFASTNTVLPVDNVILREAVHVWKGPWRSPSVWFQRAGGLFRSNISVKCNTTHIFRTWLKLLCSSLLACVSSRKSYFKDFPLGCGISKSCPLTFTGQFVLMDGIIGGGAKQKTFATCSWLAFVHFRSGCICTGRLVLLVGNIWL